MRTFAFRSWEIETPEPLGRPLRRRILERIHQFDTTNSRFARTSLWLGSPPPPDGGRFDFPEDSIVLFDLYDRLRTATRGAVDPLVGRDLELLLGYDRTYSLTPAFDLLRAEAPRAGKSELVNGRRPGRHVARHAAPWPPPLV